jgi:hypothetical protein
MRSTCGSCSPWRRAALATCSRWYLWHGRCGPRGTRSCSPRPGRGRFSVPQQAWRARGTPATTVLVTMGSVVPLTSGVGLLRELVDCAPVDAVDRGAAALRRRRAPRRCRDMPGRAGRRCAPGHPVAGRRPVPQRRFAPRADAPCAPAEPDELRSAVRAALSGALDGPVTQVRQEIAEMPPPSVVADALIALLSR